MPPARHLTPVLPEADPLGRAAAHWARVLSERAGEPVPYAFAVAVARQLPAGLQAMGAAGFEPATSRV